MPRECAQKRVTTEGQTDLLRFKNQSHCEHRRIRFCRMNTGAPWSRTAKVWIHADQGPRGRSQNLDSRFFHEERRYQKRLIDKAGSHLVLTTRVKFSMGKASEHLGVVVGHTCNSNTQEDYRFKASLGCIARPHLTYVRVCACMYTCVRVHLPIQHLRKQQCPVCRGSSHSENV